MIGTTSEPEAFRSSGIHSRNNDHHVRTELLAETTTPIDYESLTFAALARASKALTPSDRRGHLNRAAVLATWGEMQRRKASGTEQAGQ